MIIQLKWTLLTYQCETIINDVYSHWSNSMIEFDKDRIIVGGYKVLIIVNISN